MGTPQPVLSRCISLCQGNWKYVSGKGSRVSGIPLQDLRTRPGILIGSIHRGARVFIPRGQDTIEEGDSVVVVTTLPNLNDLDDILERRR